MKKLLFILTLLLVPFCVFSQQSKHVNPLPLQKFNDNVKLPLTTKERAQIIEVYGDSADKLVFNIPNRVKSIKQLLRNRVEVKLITNENDKKACPKLSEVTDFEQSDSGANSPFDPSNFNPLKYSFDFYSRSAAMYQVDNTNYYIIIKSQYQ